jgi:hypothetical protein
MISKDEIIKLIEKAEESPTLDYKEDLRLETDGDKAEFVKDVIALANSGELAHIIVGVEDGTGKPVGLRTTHDVEQLNQILKDKCDPPISVEYMEKDILKYRIGVIEFKGENPPYIVSVSDKFGGPLSSNPQRPFFIHRGTVFVRNYNMNEGARREDIDRIYEKRYATPQADLRVSHEIKKKPLGDLIEVAIDFIFENEGEVPATDPYIWVQFKNVREVVQCSGKWINISRLNKNIPTINIILNTPIYSVVSMHLGEVTVSVDKDTKKIEALVDVQAGNMHRSRGPYEISLEG